MRRHPPLIAPAIAIAIAIALAAAVGPVEAGEHKKAPTPTYFALPTLAAAAIRRDGRRGALTLESGIESMDPALMERAQASEPRLRAAFIEVLMVYASTLPYGAPPDVDYLGTEMQKAADRVLGRKGARVLLGTAIVN